VKSLADFATTPIDRALPVVILILAILFFTTKRTERTKRSVLSVLSVVILLLPPLFFRDEHTRLLAYGVVVAIAMTIAARDDIIYVIAGVALLRWIPLSDVILWRELFVLAGAIAIYFASRSALLAIAAALFTPIFPGKAMLVPFLVALILAFLPKIRVPAVAACVLFILWPWSGLMARALVPLLRAEPQPETSKPVWIALQRGESVSIDTPPNAREVTITASGANAERLRGGTVMGTVEGKPITIGDIADFGYTRREQFFRSHNPPPRRPIADIKSYGASAWLHTAGLITFHVPRGTTSIRIAAAPDLPPNTRLQIEAVDVR
jgi:hypothetical protein